MSYEKKIDKLSYKFESEVSNKMGEAETKFKDLETQLKKEHKKERKQMLEEI